MEKESGQLLRCAAHRKGLWYKNPLKCSACISQCCLLGSQQGVIFPGRCAVVPSAMSLPGAAVANRDVGPPALVTAGSSSGMPGLCALIPSASSSSALAWLPGGVNMPYVFTCWQER